LPIRTLLCLIALTVAGCAQIGAKDDLLTVSGLPRYPQCDAEIKAFVALTKLARQLGDDWQVYQPALEALQDQILDCVDDNYPNPIPI
jgi:hypothetical protein